jgi:hypothetical protein
VNSKDLGEARYRDSKGGSARDGSWDGGGVTRRARDPLTGSAWEGDDVGRALAPLMGAFAAWSSSN